MGVTAEGSLEMAPIGRLAGWVYLSRGADSLCPSGAHDTGFVGELAWFWAGLDVYHDIYGQLHLLELSFDLLGKLVGLVDVCPSAREEMEITIFFAPGYAGSQLVMAGIGIGHGIQDIFYLFFNGIGDASVHEP